MALDGAFLYAVKQELDVLIGGRTDKIYQPSREEIIISIRTVKGAYRLLISASASSARIHITKTTVDNPMSPPMFCMLLRKHLGGGKLKAIRQDGLERILYLDFECINELGDIVTVTLACEIMGKYSNIILVNQDGKIIDSIRRVDEDMSRERTVLPGMLYEFPPRDNRISFKDSDEEQIRKAVDNLRNAELSKAVIGAFEGVSPVLAREWAYYTGHGRELNGGELSDNEKDRLVFAVMSAKNALLEKKCCYTCAVNKDGLLKDFSFIRLNQYGGLMITKEFESACELLDYFYAQRDKTARLKQRANDLFRLLMNTSERITKRIANQKNELQECTKKDEMKLMGDLISANIYRINKGDKKVILENFYDESCPQIEIKLDARLTPAQNAQKYYSEYRKSVTAEKKLAEQIALGEEELEYIESVFDSLTRADTENEINELRLELAEQGYVRAVRLKGKPPKSSPPAEYVSSDGYTILLGRNNKQNDKLTLKTAAKTDMWLHTHNIPGSHAIIVTNGDTPPDRTIEEAAVIAAVNSKAKDSSQVPVDYCLVKFVKKPAGAKPGMVIFSNNKTLYVTPEKELAERLKK
ncbi:Rqc2 family fibronectin-binding protein [Porcipelethomonas sp.]|uniref:Rqc2 family fibronectin-binding protein n=1 Tax=Porcipelethomonas sp. TaxID=2981675 RepID=UPI003EF71F20